jgi:hypothetical protein
LTIHPARSSRGRDPLRGQPHRDDLPGADELAQPGADHRLQIAEAINLHRKPVAPAEALDNDPAELLGQVRIPDGGSALSTTIRTSSPAACASAS